MLFESNDENDRVECENESDFEDDDYLGVHSDDTKTEQDTSSEEIVDELDVNKEHFFEKIKNQNGRKIP